MSSDTVLYAAQRMRAGRATALVVVDAAGRPEGIVTSDALVVRCVAQNRPPDSTTLLEVMDRDVHTVRFDTNPTVALQAMTREGVARLVVVDPADRVMGLVSIDDLLWGILADRSGLGELEKLFG